MTNVRLTNPNVALIPNLLHNCHGDIHYHHDPELNHATNANPKPIATVTLTQTLTLTLRQPRSLTQNSLQKLHDGDRDYYYCQRQKESHNSDDDRCGPF